MSVKGYFLACTEMKKSKKKQSQVVRVVHSVCTCIEKMSELGREKLTLEISKFTGKSLPGTFETIRKLFSSSLQNYVLPVPFLLTIHNALSPKKLKPASTTHSL